MSQSLNSRFDKNLEALFKVNPLLAAQLQILEPNKKYEVYIGQDPLNINIYDKENKLALYAREPLVQTLEKIKEFEPLKLYPFLYFFGFVFNVFFGKTDFLCYDNTRPDNRKQNGDDNTCVRHYPV